MLGAVGMIRADCLERFICNTRLDHTYVLDCVIQTYVDAFGPRLSVYDRILQYLGNVWVDFGQVMD